MFKYLVAILSGASITGSVYMAGWGTVKNCPKDSAGDSCCDSPAAMVMTSTPMEGKIDVGNTKCIVMDGDITKNVVEYKGKIYHICCDDCIAEFKKDPEKYVAQFEANPAKYGVKKN